MSATVFDLDDLCDRWDPWDELLALKSRVPGLKVTLFAIPSQCSNGLLSKYKDLDWVELAIHGYHHSQQECAVWGYDETKAKIKEVFESGYFVPGFKPPCWRMNKEVIAALRDLGFWTCDHPGEAHLWASIAAERYVPMLRDDLVSEHGHTWDTMGNGPASWSKWFDGTEKFQFVSEVVENQVYDGVQDLNNSWSHKSKYGIDSLQAFKSFVSELTPEETVIDLGGNDGFVASHRPGTVVVDPSKPRIAFARYVFGLDARHGTLEDLPCSDKEFDWGYCSHVLEHVEDLEAAISEIHRVCKSGCFVVVPVDTKEQFKRNPSHNRRNSHQQWLQKLSATEISRTGNELTCRLKF